MYVHARVCAYVYVCVYPYVRAHNVFNNLGQNQNNWSRASFSNEKSNKFKETTSLPDLHNKENQSLTKPINLVI